MPRRTYREALRRNVMAVIETRGHDIKEKNEEEVGEEFLYFIKGATLRAPRSACRQRPHHTRLEAAHLERLRVRQCWPLVDGRAAARRPENVPDVSHGSRHRR